MWRKLELLDEVNELNPPVFFDGKIPCVALEEMTLPSMALKSSASLT